MRRGSRTTGTALVLLLCTLAAVVAPFLAGDRGLAAAVKQEDFVQCHQSGFCTRQRAYAQIADLNTTFASAWTVLEGSFVASIKDGAANTVALLVASQNRPDKTFTASFTALERGSVHFTLAETDPERQRYNLDEMPIPIMANTLKDDAFVVDADAARTSAARGNTIELSFNKGVNKLTITKEPFSFKTERDGKVLYEFNSQGFLHYETTNMPIPELETNNEERDAQEVLLNDEEIKLDVNIDPFASLKRDLYKDTGSESFRQFTDSKPHGPESIGFDIVFPDLAYAYGLAEHASSAKLRTTRVSKRYELKKNAKDQGQRWSYEPYRLYNVDIFEYLPDSPMALYGSIPLITAIRDGSAATAGAFWKNAADMWVDIQVFEKGTSDDFPEGAVHSHWFSETGALDLTFYAAESPKEISDLFTATTARAVIPPMFSIGYHQCRWNYVDENDVQEVNSGFNTYDIPYDVIWLDIEYTNGKRYFTWDERNFPTPQVMQKHLDDDGRKLVVIIDPHIKRDNSYKISKDVVDLDLAVKDKNKKGFHGWCWPGDSHWIDYLNPKAHDYWASQFALDQFNGSTHNLHIWNDMNEPSVFSGPEISMPKDNIHYGDVEHREVHNLYGILLHSATYTGLVNRTNGVERPFVLSRSFFPGTQSFGAIWTGDNQAKWEYLKVSTPMLLSLGLSGITFAGSDVGGFFGNPDSELFVRWYQLGVFNPFFRGHAHLDAARREPWVYGEPVTSFVRDAIRLRYKLLPYIYTLFAETSEVGTPLVRPTFYEFPGNAELFGLEDQFMFGSALLVNPVVAPGQTRQRTVLPFSKDTDRWFVYGGHDGKDWSEIVATKNKNKVVHEMRAPISIPTAPMYVRGGHMLAEATRNRRSAVLALWDPLRLVVALDKSGSSHGRIFRDDGTTIHSGSINLDIVYNGETNTLEARSSVVEEGPGASAAGTIFIEEVVILGLTDSKGKRRQPSAAEASYFDSSEAAEPVKLEVVPADVPGATGGLSAVRIKAEKDVLALGSSWDVKLLF